MARMQPVKPGLTPTGVTDGSRWSQRSGDHRKVMSQEFDPGGVAESAAILLRHPPGSFLRTAAIRWCRLRLNHRLPSVIPAGIEISTPQHWSLPWDRIHYHQCALMFTGLSRDGPHRCS